MGVGPVGMKYWGGWGDGTDVTSGQTVQNIIPTSEIFKLLRKYTRRDKEYIHKKWRKKYLQYVALLLNEDDEEAQLMALNDNYLKRLDRELGS